MRLPEEVRWVKRGRQRRAVVQVLRKPMTGSQIWKAARSINPRLQLRDVWWLCRELAACGLVVGLNSHRVTGRVYFLTDRGRAVAQRVFEREVQPSPGCMDWKRYGWVMRGRIRRQVLQAMERGIVTDGNSASEIRRRLLETCPMGLNATLRALHELTQCRLTARVTRVGRRKTAKRKLYVLTAAGRRMVEELRR